ncbi:MAG TPA: MFS transporter [Chitinophagaceae bacterium]|nr:MFS transporter [Chitinophagaceae bacterium]
MNTKLPSKQSNNSALATIISVFFFWGFVAASNGILIPVLKNHFTLSQFESQLVDTAFYIAYGVGSLIYFVWSMTAGDPLNKIGYKKGLVIGLIISSIGALLFIPAVNFNEYLYFLIGLFFIAFGFSLLQIVANPFVINLGDPAKGSFRLNLAGSINSLGTSVGPVLFAYALYGSASSQAVKDIGMEAVKIPFLILSGLLFFLAIFLNFSKLPTIKNEEVNEQSIGAFKFPQLTLGMLAIFIYVGVEVAIGSNLPALIGHIRGLEGDKIANVAAPFVSLYWGSLMIGRWTGAINVFDMTKNTKLLLNILIPFVAFSVVLFFNHIRGTEIGELYIYVIWIVLFIIANFMAQEKPARTLMLFGIAASIMMLIGIFSKGDIAIFSFMSGGLFCSVMWPCIFNLAIAGLGKYTNQGSSLLVMMIIGGAFIPPIQGLICDLEKVHPEGILNVSYTQFSYIVSTLCFLYLAWYGMKVRTILIKQGIDYDKKSEAGH